MITSLTVLFIALGHTVNLSQLPDIDSMPVCHVEDCSDVPAVVSGQDNGIWIDPDTGNAYVECGQFVALVIDDTVRN